MKKILLPLLVLPCLAFGQAKFGLIDSIELEKMQQAAAPLSTGEYSEAQLTFLMRVDGDDAAARVEAAGAVIEQREGNILVVTAPLSRVTEIAATEGVVTVSLSKAMHAHAEHPWGNDLSRSRTGLTDVLNGQSPLPQAYNGEGVILGVIDMGIDVHHAAFLNEDGTHRTTRAWKHVQNGKSTLTISSDTEEKIAKFRSDDATMTHGTHVLGIAAGSFNDGEYDFRGGASGSEIVISCGESDHAHLLKGLRSIVDYAKSQGKPCVINISLGNNAGPHDGTDEFPAALNAIAGEEGVNIFVSAGNEGAYKAFLHKTFEAGETTLKTIIAPSAYTSYLFPNYLSLFPQAFGDIEIWSDDSTPFTVSIDFIKVSDGKAEVIRSLTVPDGGSAYISTPLTGKPATDIGIDDDETFNTAYKTSSVLASTGLYAGNQRYRAEISFQLESTDQTYYNTHFISLRIEGKEGHKIYSYSTGVSGVFPFEFRNMNLAGYTESTGDGSINALAGADNVITVGSFITHNFKPTTTWGFSPAGMTAGYTSWGTTPDGRKHPMINAPGHLIVSAMSSEYYEGSAYSAEEQPVYYTYTDGSGKKHHFTPMTGTSMASPFMAGTAAAWLSADPTLTTAEIIAIAQETSKAPTMKRPNDGAAGHLDAFAGLCRVLGLSGVGNVKADKDLFDISRQGNVLTIRSTTDTDLSAVLYNLQGAAVRQAACRGNELTLDAQGLAAGVYILSVKAGNATGTSKITVN